MARLSAFYQRIAGLGLRSASAEREVLASPDFQLVIVAIPPAELAALPPVPSPVVPRPTAVKLFFTVPSLAVAEVAAAELGGAVYGPEWPGPGFRARNACDPEGNVFQLRERVTYQQHRGSRRGSLAAISLRVHSTASSGVRA